MEVLKSYLSIIDPRLLHHVQGQAGTFIRVFQDQDYLSEEAFIQCLYAETGNRNNYQELKSRTIKMLQALAIVSTSRGNSLVKKKYDFCLKKFTIGQKFLNQGQRGEGLRLIKQAHRVAVEFDFVHLVCELASILHYDHVSYHPNPRKASFYATQSENYIHDYLAEKHAEKYLFQAIALMEESLKPEQLKDVVQKAKGLTGKSLKCITYQSMLQVLYGFHMTDYQLIIKTSKQALKYFEKKKGVYSSHYHFFLTNLGIALMANKLYKEAEKNLIKALDYAPAKSINEYIIALYRTTNALHARQYSVAYKLYQQNKKCRFEQIRQQFAIIQAYLCFLSHIGYLHLDGKFRLGKYLNDTFKAQHDKQGSNITILIAELLVHLARDRGKFIDRVEAINNYSYRHLKGADTKRAKRFIKILCLLPRANFNAIALQRVASRQIKYLEEHPIHLGDNVALEIIPFGDLLGMVMKGLEGKRAVG